MSPLMWILVGILVLCAFVFVGAAVYASLYALGDEAARQAKREAKSNR